MIGHNLVQYYSNNVNVDTLNNGLVPLVTIWRLKLWSNWAHDKVNDRMTIQQLRRVWEPNHSMPAHRVDIELHQNNLNLAAQDMVCKEARDVLQIFLNTEQILNFCSWGGEIFWGW